VHLEKVTTRSSEAGLAGWIASNDVTLFTVVLIMAVAVFLHSQLKGSEQAADLLSDEKDKIAALLASTASDLDSVRELLDSTKDTLQLTQEERDKLQQQLVEKLEALARLSAQLDALLDEKGDLESQRQALLAETQALSKQANELAASRDTLSESNMSLRERLDALAAQLEAKIAALADVEAQRKRLEEQAAELDSIVAALKKRMQELNIELVEAKDEAVALRVASDEEVEQLKAQVAAGDEKSEQYLAQLKRAAALLQSLKLEKQNLQKELSEAERLRQAQLLAEAENNRELIGLKGKLQRVAIVFDASGSMRAESEQGVGDRWAEAQEILGIWLRHLNIEQCVVVVYSTRVRTIPEDGSFVDLRGEVGRTKRESLLEQVGAIAPGGTTNTYDALRTAYGYDIDTIVLLTDGAPSREASGVYDDALAQQIYQLCRTHTDIPVNTIGLGNYFDADMATFLRTVASITGGSFRGE
jgi:predicted nuclease with TOPRIM domain